MPNQKSVLLPTHIKPSRYRIMLRPDLEKFTFWGEETIYLDITKQSKEITLHAEELEIESVNFKNSKLKISNFKITYNKKHETVTFTTSATIPKGSGELFLTFRGVLNDKLRGFYRSKYTVDEKEKYLATTQFEATDARRAFPCLDEPAAKAIFDVTLIVPQDLTAISNTIETEVLEHEAGYKMVKFLPTPKMSTYLLAFIVGDFEFLEGRTKNQVLVRVFVTPGKKHQAQFALDCAIKTLDFYEQYFAVKYPLPVLDLIAIPDFASGAMENWGAVTYRETALLVDAKHSSTANKQWVALVIAHELAHQWFGNLVTMKWWTHLWLNEGFASYIEYLAVNELFPQWDIWTQFAYADLGVALHLDALKNTHPIEVEVHHPDEISEIFDEVSYSKGSSIIRMLADYLGEKNFRNGLRYYLKKHSYGNAVTEDLWKAFEKISGKPVRQIMKNWTGTAGYPMVKIIEQPNALELSQTRFFTSPISAKQYTQKQSWSVPVSLMTNKSKRADKFLFSKTRQTIKKPKGEWTKLNIGETGFYRTDYPAQMLQALQKPVRQKKLPAIDRLGIIRDAFSLAEAGQVSTAQALELALGYAKETDYTVWVELASALDQLDLLLHRQSYYPEFKSYGLRLFKNIAQELGWAKPNRESHTATLLRSIALFHFGSFGDRSTIDRARKMFQNYLKTGEKPPADLRGVVYTLAAQNGGRKEFEFLKREYIRESIHEEKNRLGRALGQFADIKILQKTLEFAISDSVRYQDTPSLTGAVFTNPAGSDLAWKFMKTHWSLFLERYGQGGLMLSRIIKPASHFATKAAAADVAAFFKTHQAPGAARTIQQIIERINSNALWLGRDAKKIGNFLAGQR